VLVVEKRSGYRIIEFPSAGDHRIDLDDVEDEGKGCFRSGSR
jgi:hypothetical protein